MVPPVTVPVASHLQALGWQTFFLFFFLRKNIYLFGCTESLQRAVSLIFIVACGFSAVACKLLVVACGIWFPDSGSNLGLLIESAES